MKTYLLIFFYLIGVHYSNGQSQRLVLIEEGSNASCGPCAAQNPAFNTLLEANSTKVVSLKYQWDFPGYDPMNEHNPSEVATRFETYYGQNGVPTAMLDGTVPSFGGNPYDGAPAGFTTALIDTRYAAPSPFDISLTYSITPETITVNCTTTCTQATSGDFKLRIAVVEKLITFATAPGSNGETEFHNVMKKFLPNAGGIAMAGSYAVGETFTTTQTWNLANVYDINEVAVVAFIQNDANKEVMQAQFAEGVAVTPANSIDAVASSISGVDGFSCVGTITPTVTIQNYGSTPLTSCNVNYEINGTTGSIPWTGNLAFYETGTVSLGTINFTPDNSNVLNVITVNPNGGTDENTANNEQSIEVGIAGFASLNITVEIRTDYYPGETSWEIREDNGTLVTSFQYEAGTADEFGGGGPDATTTKTHQVTLAPNKCYSFKLFDSYGDGMGYTGGVTTAPPFGYTILNSTGEIIIQDLADNFSFGDVTENALRSTSFFQGQISESGITNGNPNPISFTSLPGGCASFSYQWYSFIGITSAPTGSSTSGWTMIPGATASSYDPPTLFQSTTFACFVTPSAGCGTSGWAQGAASFTITVSAGQVNSTAVQQCEIAPVDLNFTTAPNGLGNVSYQWYYQNGEVACPQGSSTFGWQIVSGANAATSSFTPTSEGTFTLACFINSETGIGLWASGCKPVVSTSFTAQEIIGNTTVTPFTPTAYLVSQVAGHTYEWAVTGGAIANGQGTNFVNVVWNNTGPYSIQLLESDGVCSDVSVLDLGVVTGFIDEEKSEITIFPNPASDVITIRGLGENGEGNYTIYDLSGRALLSGSYSNDTFSVPLNKLQSGNYLINFIGSNTNIVRHFNVTRSN